MSEFFPEAHIFTLPPTRAKGPAICPVFIPFSGCARRCCYCAQDIQTGRPAAPVRSHLEAAAPMLAERVRRGLPAVELAFFGGTFTALPPGDLDLCLEFALRWRARGAVHSFRCSTRPDCLEPVLLASLKEAGCSLVELGVQSFSNPALILSGRGYTGDAARAGCRMVRESGLGLGIQLMPGLPGQTPEAAWRDIELTAALKPACVRLYPCLVLAGSALAGLWRAGLYTPWTLPESVEFLARACMLLEGDGIPIARMGLAEESGLKELVLDGPRHPALGNMVRALVLQRRLHGRVRDFRLAFPGAPPRLFAPHRFQGEFWGYGGELAPSYALLGLDRNSVIWWGHEHFALTRGTGDLSQVDCRKLT